MAPITLVQPRIDDVDEILAFELENRAYFEASVNARPSDYYSPRGVAAAIESSVAEAIDDQAYQYLIRDEDAVLVGRINLSRVRRAHFHSAEVGYRVARSMGGRGVASRAVQEVLDIAFRDKKLLRIEAMARPENVGSVRVLERNGFVAFGRSSRSFELRGVWYDRLHFERHAP